MPAPITKCKRRKIMKAANPLVKRLNPSRYLGLSQRAFAISPRALRGLCAVIALSTLCLLLCGASVSASGGGKSVKKRTPKASDAKSAGTSGNSPVMAKAKDASASAPAKPEHIGIEHEQFAYPPDGGLRKYALVVKHKEGNKLFETDPRLISLSLTPAGAADITIRRVTPTRIEADFWAPDKFEVNDVSVSIYDRDNPRAVVASSDIEKAPEESDTAEGADLKDGTVRTAAMKAKAKAKSDADADTVQPEISSTTIVFLQRAYGIGRLKIEGKNFGNYEAPPVSAEDYLLCYEPLARQALVEALKDNPQAVVQQKIEDKRCDDLKGSPKFAVWKQWRETVEKSVKVALVPRNTDLRIEQTKVLYIDDKLIDVYFEFNRYYRNSEPLRLASTTVTVRKGGEPKPDAKTGAQSMTAANGSSGRSVGDAVLMNASASVAAAESKSPPPAEERKTYIATKEVGTKQDENLEYRYTVLDENSATTLFGKGVADSFYVIQLSVTNKGEKKMSIPLASIQAEVEWAYGKKDSADKKQGHQVEAATNAQTKGLNSQNEQKDVAASLQNSRPDGSNAEAKIPLAYDETLDYYEEGPATLAPLPLPAVTAFFDGDAKVNGRKAKLFNITDGMAMLGSSLIPFFGPGFRDAHVAFTGGLVPGIRRGIGDLSGQQLQNLTALSWQGVEVVAAKGGSIEKFVFIQRGDQLFSPGFGERLRKTIKNIEGMEVIGFEVQESEPKRATPAGQQ
jgi:hypothetical protein